AEPGRVAERAVIAVDPEVIGTAQHLAAAVALLEQPRAAMPADVVKGTQAAVGAAEDEQLPVGELDGQILTRLRDLGRRTQHLPVPAKDRLPLVLIDACFRVVAWRKVLQHRLCSRHRSLPSRFARLESVEGIDNNAIPST